MIRWPHCLEHKSIVFHTHDAIPHDSFMPINRRRIVQTRKISMDPVFSTPVEINEHWFALLGDYNVGQSKVGKNDRLRVKDMDGSLHFFINGLWKQSSRIQLVGI